uniref:Conserved domain protein n=1 Tax=Strongyloides venezuelensis TaxID=75913 RepID=A0A0K0F822_STRVS
MTSNQWAKQLYYFFIPSFPIASLFVEGVRDENFFTKFLVKRATKEISSEFSNLIENEVDSFLLDSKKNVIKNVEFKVSLFNELLPKTWGSLLLKNGAEFQFPVLFDTKDHEVFREYLRGQFISLKDKPIPYKVVNECLINDESRKFCIQRELQKSYSGYHLCLPSIMWIFSSSAFYGLCTFIFPVIGVPIGCLISALGTIGVYSYLIKIIKSNEEVYFDNVVIDKNEVYKTGAIDYLKSSKILCNLIGEEYFGESNLYFINNRISNIKRITAESRLLKVKNTSVEKNEKL